MSRARTLVEQMTAAQYQNEFRTLARQVGLQESEINKQIEFMSKQSTGTQRSILNSAREGLRQCRNR